MPTQPRIHVNLLPGFFTAPQLQASWARLETLAEVSRSSVHTPEDIDPYLNNLDAILMWSWPQPTAAQLDRLGKRYTFSGHLDLVQGHAQALLDRGVALSASRSGFSPAVAEMALLLILTSLRRASTYHAAMWSGTETDQHWLKNFPDDIDPNERQLTGRRVGIIGFGKVGQRLGELLKPFNCRVQIVDPFLPDAVAEKCGVQKVSLETLAAENEVVVLCAASNSGTQRLINQAVIDRLQPNAVFVNVARAALVETDALMARLQRGELFAALDVFDREPLDKDSPLRRLPNLYLTPHRAGGIMESVQRNIDWLIDDFEAHLKGEPASTSSRPR